MIVLCQSLSFSHVTRLFEKKENMNRLVNLEQTDCTKNDMKCSGLLKLSIRFVNNTKRIFNGFLPPIPSPTMRHCQTLTLILMRCFWPSFFCGCIGSIGPTLDSSSRARVDRVGLPTRRYLGLQEFQSVNNVLHPSMQVFVATAALFGL